jgi:hypothetical protein
MKALVGATDDGILGFAMIGAEAGEVMAVVQTAMLAGLPYPKLRDTILAHPTMAEGLNALFATIPAAESPSRQRYNPEYTTEATRTDATSHSGSPKGIG